MQHNILEAITRSFIYLDEKTLMRLYTALVRPHVEYAKPVWNPRLKRNIEAGENIQRRATKIIPGIRDLSYKERLEHLNLPTLAYRRIRGDMIETYKMLKGYYDKEVSNLLPLHSEYVENPDQVRGHSKKLYKKRPKL